MQSAMPVKKRLLLIIIIGLVLALAVLLALLGFRNKSLSQSLKDERSINQALQTKNDQIESSNIKSSDTITTTITETLPNGRKVTFPDTESNRRVLWFVNGTTDYDKNGPYVLLSDKLYQQYLLTVDPSIVAKVCGNSSDPSGQNNFMIYGTLDTETKKVIAPQNENCVDSIAFDDRNTDSVSKSAAQKIEATIKSDIENFVNSVAIQ